MVFEDFCELCISKIHFFQLVLFRECPKKYFSHPAKSIYLLDNHSLDVLESISFRVKELFLPLKFLISELDFYCHRHEKAIIIFLLNALLSQQLLLIVLISNVIVILISVSE